MQHRGQNGHGRTSSWLLILLLAVGLTDLHPVSAAGEDPPPRGPAVLRADAAGLTLEWSAPAFSLRTLNGDDRQSYQIVEAPGWGQTEEPGQPQLPFASALVVVPPAGEVTLSVQVLARAHQPLLHPVVPARAPVPVGNPPTDVEWAWARDEHTYAGQQLYPASVVTLKEAGWMRSHRLMRLTFCPLRFDPAGNMLEVTNQVRVQLHFQTQSLDVAQKGSATAGEWDRDDPFVSTLQHAVINPDQVTHFARLEQPVAAPAPASLSGAVAYPPAGTQYLIIAHSKFITAVAPLASHRAVSDGLHVFSTTVEAISGGLSDPLAIRDYISHTYHSAVPPTLRYVLLVGDGVLSSSAHAQSLNTAQTFIPPYVLTMKPPWYIGSPYEAASDNRFVTMDGPDDQIADIFVGRLPVNTVAEATTIVNKILAYELNPLQWPWNKRVLFFAGDEKDAEYHDHSDQVYMTVPITYARPRVYFCVADSRHTCNEPHLYTDIVAARAATIRELNVGGLLASFVGHSSWLQWTYKPVTLEPMFHADDVPQLHNGGALPVVLEMTCYTSDFSQPEYVTLDEALLCRQGGGAVATFGPTTIGLSNGHTIMHEGFYHAVFSDHIEELGPIIERAKVALVQEGNPYYLDLLDTFVLLGDPAMDLNLHIVPWTHAAFLPVTLRGYH